MNRAGPAGPINSTGSPGHRGPATIIEPPPRFGRRSAQPAAREPVTIDLHPGFDELREQARARVAAPPKRRGGLLLIAFVALAAGLGIGVVLFRQPMVIEALGLRGTTVPAAPELRAGALEVGSISAVRIFARGASAITVEGEIRNTGGRAIDVPPLRFDVRDGDGNLILTRTIDPPVPSLGPTATARFTAELAASPVDAVDIVVSFGDARAASVEVP